MVAITISSELGSGGVEIGRRVAESLGWEFVDKNTSDSILRQYGLTKFSQLYNSIPSILDLINTDNLLIVAMLNEIVQALAKRGSVIILGRAGFAVLGRFADVLNVHIQAPFDERVKRILEREGLPDLQTAEERVRDDDTLHRKYVQRFYNRQWDEPAGFGLILNTGALSSETVVKQIVDVARAMQQKALAKNAITTRDIEVDPVLADAVEKVMSHPSQAKVA